MIRVVVDDIAFVPADAVIRPTTAALEPTCSSLTHLESVGGPAFRAQLTLQEELAVGSAVVTGAGDLTADLVIHAVVRSAEQPVTEQHVRRALISVLQRAGDWQLSTLALPPIGTGPGNLEIEDAARLMVDVLSTAMATATYPQHVCIVVDNEQDRAVFDMFLRRTPQ